MAPAVHTNASLTAAFASRFPQAGTVDSLSASAEQPGKVHSLEAMAVRNATAVGKQQWVKATEHFYAQGQPVLVGDFVQVPEQDAVGLRNRSMATFATEDEVAAAQKKGGK